MMTLQELIQKCDYVKIAEIWSGWIRPREKAQDINHIEGFVRDFCQTLSDVEARPSDDIILAMWVWQNGEIEVEAELFHKQDMEQKEFENMEFPIYTESDGTEKLSSLLHNTHGWIPESYCYLYSPWEDVLGAEVVPENYNRIGQNAFVASVLWELSFNGITRAQQEAQRKKLEDALAEVAYLDKLPQEERKKHYISHEELMKEFGWEDLRTDEEIEEEHQKCLLDSVRTREAMLAEFKKIRC
jgi:hypothetical protein